MWIYPLVSLLLQSMVSRDGNKLRPLPSLSNYMPDDVPTHMHLSNQV